MILPTSVAYRVIFKYIVEFIIEGWAVSSLDNTLELFDFVMVELFFILEEFLMFVAEMTGFTHFFETGCLSMFFI
jgi:hypothetical protein